ncbi:MAG: hypothetical protein J1E32_07280 [Treponema sp.]|nr:hypothetical protein [Treponema sp.]
MKRILHFGGVLLALGMLLASCNIGVGDGQVSGDSVRNTSNVEGIVLKIGGIDNSSRTILPADWTDDTAEKLTYVLLAKESLATGSTGYSTMKTFSYSELKNGTATVNLKLVTWDLKLIGYITKTPGTPGTGDTPGTSPVEDDTKACLAAEETNVKFSTGKKSVTFNLKPVQKNEDGTESQATGSTKLGIVWDTDQPKRLEFGIYAQGTSTTTIIEDTGRDKVASSLETTPEKLRKILKGDELSKNERQNTAEWSVDDKVKNGIYKFAAVFYNEEEEGEGKVIGYYIDILYVDGGNLSEEKIQYGNKFQTKPENPTWLAVETLFVPQGLNKTVTEGSTTYTPPVNNLYYAKFHWDDVSNNETGFELVITEDDGTEHVVSSEEDEEHLISTTWYDESEAKEKPFDDPETATATSIINTMDAGRTWVVLKLETQKKYTAKIRAINDLNYDDDDPEFCENLNRNGDGKGRTYAPIVTDGTGTTAKKQFGMFTVNYALDGSTVTGKDGKTINTSITNYVVGYNYSDQQQNLMGDSDRENPHITNDVNHLNYWQTTTETNGKKVPMPVIPAKNIDNLELEPVWLGTDVSVHVTFPSYANANDVKIVKGQNEANTVPFKYIKEDDDNNHISVTAGDSLDDPQFELTDLKGAVVTDGISAPRDKMWTWTPTKAPEAGFYRLQITGQYEDAGSGRTLTLCGNVYIEVKN